MIHALSSHSLGAVRPGSCSGGYSARAGLAAVIFFERWNAHPASISRGLDGMLLVAILVPATPEIAREEEGASSSEAAEGR